MECFKLLLGQCQHTYCLGSVERSVTVPSDALGVKQIHCPFRRLVPWIVDTVSVIHHAQKHVRGEGVLE